MRDAAEIAVRRVITAMLENLNDDLTIDDMARIAMFSKFHFSRMFQRVTGVSPGRFLSALRLQRAKQLLLSTSFNIADISHRVGYTSVGTFSSRFTRSVGISPIAYRRLRGQVHQVVAEPHLPHVAHMATKTVRGRVWREGDDDDQLIFVGLFRERIPEGRPVSCTVLKRPGPFVLDQVAPGTWYLLVASSRTDTAAGFDPYAAGANHIEVGIVGPIAVRGDVVIEETVHLEPAGALDPPVLLGLYDAQRMAMQRIAETVAAAA
jgi:AraC family transcriptional regulator